MNEPLKRKSFNIFADRRIMVIAFLGFASGLPFPLIFATLSLWLKEAGVDIALIGALGLARAPYSFKFLWAPFIDHLSLGKFSEKLGRRRAWGIVTQVGIMLSLMFLAFVSPSEHLGLFTLGVLAVAFASASQDIVIDAFRIEALNTEQQGAGAGVLVAGYRVAMLVSGAGALILADYLPWRVVYLIMASLMLIGIFALMIAKEPEAPLKEKPQGAGWIKAALFEPLKDFMQNKGWLAIIIFIMTYKLSEAYLGAMSGVFYLELGFSKTEIAGVIKVFGFGATIVGGLLGGILVARIGALKSLFWCGIVQGLAPLMFIILAKVGANLELLTLFISLQNIAAGMATSAFVAYMSGLCNKAYTATQYALLSSLTGVGRDFIAALSGAAVKALGWQYFFVLCSTLSLPALLLLLLINRRVR